jgi:hypothetical protein
MMNLRMPDKYYQAAIFLLLVSSVFIALPLFIHIGDTTTAACVIAGMVFIMTGIFIFTLSGGETMDPRLVGILTAQGCITLCRISSELGSHGNAHFVPPRFTGKSRVMQLNQGTKKDDGFKILVEKSVLKIDHWGFMMIPSCDLLIQDLKERNAMIIPDKPQEISVLLNEIICDIFDFASRVSATWDGNQLTITLHEYQFAESCQILTQNSPQCCKKNPCPVCSLCGVLIAEGMNEIVIVQQCSSVPSSQEVTLTFRIAPIAQ